MCNEANITLRRFLLRYGGGNKRSADWTSACSDWPFRAGNSQVIRGVAARVVKGEYFEQAAERLVREYTEGWKGKDWTQLPAVLQGPARIFSEQPSPQSANQFLAALTSVVNTSLLL